MSPVDWFIVVFYICLLICLGIYLGKNQNNVQDYFLGARTIKWWAIGLSTMATQLGAVSFISAPAFVGLRPGGGMIWLGYEFAVPLAMIFLIGFVIPIFHRGGYISIYQFLEVRFGRNTRLFVSGIFLVSRGLATGISIYAVALVLSVILNISIIITIAIIGTAAVLYDFAGGIKAVIYSDVIQMFLIVAGIIICITYGLEMAGGWSKVVKSFEPGRLAAVKFHETGIGSSGDFGFLPLLLGGFFLYTSYYGFDQSQVQRELSAKSVLDSQKSLIFNALMRYPLVLLYCILGLIVGSFAVSSPGFMEKIPTGQVDYMIPVFVIYYLPAGFKGIIVTAVLAASMSSLDSALNSLSASTVEDFLKKRFLAGKGDRHVLLSSRYVTLFWGIFCTGFAMISGGLSATIIESINMIGSIFYGPVAAVFVLGMFTKRTSSLHVITGGAAGVLTNLFFAAGFVKISWLWWNVTGFVITCVTGILLSIIIKAPSPDKLIEKQYSLNIRWVAIYCGLIFYCAAIVLFSAKLQTILQ